MSTQPEALRLADELDAVITPYSLESKAAAELRRLAAENESLKAERDEDRRRDYGYSQQVVDALTKERDVLRAQRDALKQTLHDELAGNLRLRDLGGARPDEPMLTFLERIIAERDALLEALRLMMDCAGGIATAPDSMLEMALDDDEEETRRQANAFLVARAAIAKAEGRT